MSSFARMFLHKKHRCIKFFTCKTNSSLITFNSTLKKALTEVSLQLECDLKWFQIHCQQIEQMALVPISILLQKVFPRRVDRDVMAYVNMVVDGAGRTESVHRTQIDLPSLCIPQWNYFAWIPVNTPSYETPVSQSLSC